MWKKENKTLAGLRLCYYKDFKVKKIYFESFEDFEKNLISKIRSSDRSVKDQKIEAIAKLEQNKHKNFLSIITLILSFTGLIISSLFNIANNETLGVIALIAMLLIELLYVLIIQAGGLHRKTYENISYYTIKLQCIEEIEKDSKEKRCEDGWQKVKYSIKAL